MKLTFGYLAGFVGEWKRLRLNDEDLQALESLIMKRPQAGEVMRGTGGLRKIRFAPPSWHAGKSGAARVCYVYFVEAAECDLLTIFPKNVKPNLNNMEKAAAKRLIDAIRTRLGKKEQH